VASPAEANIDNIDAEQLTRLLELELIQKRASWKQSGKRYQSYRAMAFFFLFLMIVGCLAGGYFVFTRVTDQHASPSPASTITR
jgi:hypothetical protein